MIMALLVGGAAGVIIRCAMGFKRQAPAPQGPAERLDYLVKRYGVERMAPGWVDVYVNGERPFSFLQLREMLSYYDEAA